MSDITPGSIPAQLRLAKESHKALYGLSLLWPLSQTLVDALTAENGFSVHPFLKDKIPGQFLALPEHMTRIPNPFERLTSYKAAISTIYSAAIPIKAKDLLEIPDHHKDKPPPPSIYPLSPCMPTRTKSSTSMSHTIRKQKRV